jgi:hypothetical protein
MTNALASECRYGVFKRFRYRLLLWRVLKASDGIRGITGNGEDRLPSWSWMTHNQIEFFPEGQISVPKSGGIKFGSGHHLYSPVRRLQDCKIEQEGGRHMILDNERKDVGELWFDGITITQTDNCAIVGLQGDDVYFIALVVESSNNYYQRVGTGMIKARYISEHSSAGALV